MTRPGWDYRWDSEESRRTSSGHLRAISVGGLNGVVPLARLHLQAVSLALDVDLAIAPIQLVVSRGIAGDVLGAQLFLDLRESIFHLLAVVAYVDDSPTGLFRHFPHVRVTAIAHGVNAPPVEAAIGDQQNVHDGIGFLRGFDRALQFLRAALIFAIGEKDDGLTPSLLLQLVMRGQINRVIEESAFGRT